MTSSHHRLALLLALGLAGLWLGAAGLAVASARLPAAASGRVLAVFPPGLERPEIATRILAAGGLPLQSSGPDFAWTAYSTADGFVGRLEAEGALLVIPPVGRLRFAGICGAGMELLASPADGAAGLR